MDERGRRPAAVTSRCHVCPVIIHSRHPARPSALQLLWPEAGSQPPPPAGLRLPRARLCTHNEDGPRHSPVVGRVLQSGIDPRDLHPLRSFKKAGLCPQMLLRPHFLVFHASGRDLADATPAPGSPSMPPWATVLRREPGAVCPACESSPETCGSAVSQKPPWQLFEEPRGGVSGTVRSPCGSRGPWRLWPVLLCPFSGLG